jgi:hypothetical protein
MARKAAPKPDDAEQAKRFVAMAKQLEVDESPGAFEKALDKVVPARKESHRRKSP